MLCSHWWLGGSAFWKVCGGSDISWWPAPDVIGQWASTAILNKSSCLSYTLSHPVHHHRHHCRRHKCRSSCDDRSRSAHRCSPSQPRSFARSTTAQSSRIKHHSEQAHKMPLQRRDRPFKMQSSSNHRHSSVAISSKHKTRSHRGTSHNDF